MTQETKKALELPCGDNVDIVETSNGREYWYNGAPLWNPQKVHRVALQAAILHEDEQKYKSRAALSQSPQGDADYTVYLLERQDKDGSPEYLLYNGFFDFTKNADDALHFIRRRDADAIGGESLDDLRIVEHMWPRTTTPQPETGADDVIKEAIRFLQYAKMVDRIEYRNKNGMINCHLKPQHIDGIIAAITARKVDAQTVDVEKLKKRGGTTNGEDDYCNAWNDCIDHLASAGHLKAQTWQPIDKYVHDETKSYLVTDGVNVSECRYYPEQDSWFEEGSHPSDYIDRSFRGITHFMVMPLPPAPAADEGAK